MHKATKQNVPTQIQKRRGAEHKAPRREEKCVHQMIKTDRQLIGLI